MILGIGVDTVQIARIQQAIEKNIKFLERVFTPNEINIGLQKKDKFIFFAGRWAVKEAIAKALGVGIGKDCAFLDIEVLNDKLGKPVVEISNSALNYFSSLEGKNIFCSISHDNISAVAMVVLEK